MKSEQVIIRLIGKRGTLWSWSALDVRAMDGQLDASMVFAEAIIGDVFEARVQQLNEEWQLSNLKRIPEPIEIRRENIFPELKLWAQERFESDAVMLETSTTTVTVLLNMMDDINRTDMDNLRLKDIPPRVELLSYLLEMSHSSTTRLTAPNPELGGLSLIEFPIALIVMDLRKLGCSWVKIAPLLHMSPAGAHRKYSQVEAQITTRNAGSNDANDPLLTPDKD